jgi:hypothetical protein
VFREKIRTIFEQLNREPDGAKLWALLPGLTG